MSALGSAVKLDHIIRELIIEEDRNTEHVYARYLQLAIHGLREMHYDMTGVPKVAIIPVDENTLTAPLPKDYIKYVKIGICGGDGLFHAMAYDKRICMNRSSDECGNPKVGTQQEVTISLSAVGNSAFTEGLSDNFRNGELVGRFFGIGGGSNSIGSYRIDMERGTIELSSDYAHSEVVMEYIATLESINGDYMVHPHVVETLKAYIYWASIRKKRYIDQNTKEAARRDYYTEKYNSYKRFSSFNVHEALQYSRKAFKLAPKL